jgi:hypothetical protein
MDAQVFTVKCKEIPNFYIRSTLTHAENSSIRPEMSLWLSAATACLRGTQQMESESERNFGGTMIRI